MPQKIGAVKTKMVAKATSQRGRFPWYKIPTSRKNPGLAMASGTTTTTNPRMNKTSFLAHALSIQRNTPVPIRTNERINEIHPRLPT